jgi:hypothetical protein
VRWEKLSPYSVARRKDMDGLPSDMALASEHHGHISRLLHRAETSNGSQVRSGVRIAGDHLGLDECRGDGVDGDPAALD